MNNELKGFKSVVTTDFVKKSDLWHVKLFVKYSFSEDLVNWHDLEIMSEKSADTADKAYQEALKEILNMNFFGKDDASFVL